MSTTSPQTCASLGAVPCESGGVSGVRFAVWAPHANAVWVCLFDGTPSAGPTETARHPLRSGDNGVWSTFVPGVGVGQLYGLRADGPWEPEAGHRFNPQRLLIDPWALALVGPQGDAFERLALQTGHACDNPQAPCQPWSQHSPSREDNAHAVPLCAVVDAATEHAAARALAPRPGVPRERVFIYEAHVKALTRQHPGVPEAQRGTYAGLAHPTVVEYLRRLGVTTVCLLPVHQHITERHLLARGLSNHWGYNTLNAFTPEPGYAACTGGQAPASAAEAAGVRAEFRSLVDALHRAGIEVVLDVVFNHTCESDPDGPTLSWRGLGQTDWYAMGDQGVPHNFSGCGNSLAVSQPRVVQWVMDSLRWWVQAFGVDGFRFDLAVSLGRDAALHHGFNPHSALLTAMAQDPVLAGCHLIAEPWDVGPHGHHTGGFAPGWAEWNDTFRDTVRAHWLGHPATRGELASAVCGSSARFAHHGRGPLASVNMVTAHDGFTLADLTSHRHKHNHANGEDNRDGHGHNLSDNAGAEGPSDDPGVLHRRGLLRRALLATVLCAQGTPQLLAGDEQAHSQQGNNNAYCQDNPLTWLAWPTPGDTGPTDPHSPAALTAFVASLAALRQRHPGLRHPRWFTGQPLPGEAHPDIAWLDVDGQPPSAAAWDSTAHRTLAATVTVGEGSAPATERLLLVWHAGHGPTPLTLPPGPWWPLLDSARAWVANPGDSPVTPLQDQLPLNEPGVHVLAQPLHDAAFSHTPPGP